MKFKFLIGVLMALSMILAACGGDSSEDENEEVQAETEEEASEDENTEEENEDEGTEDATEEDTTEETSTEESDDAEASTEDEQDTDQSEQASTDPFDIISYDVPEGASEEPMNLGMPAKGYVLDTTTGANFNIVVEDLPPEMGLDTKGYIDVAIENQGLEPESRETLDINGREWIELEITYENTLVNQRTFVHNNQAFVFSYSALPDSYEEHLPTFDEIVESVEIAE